MTHVTSKDGTTIAYDRAGSGPPLVLVGGALTSRTFGVNVSLARHLADRFAVFSYDRRGRGDSSDTTPYAVQREIEDVEAVIDAAGGHACLYGISSGAVLALEAACALPGKVDKLALYEAPCVVDDTRPPVPADAPALAARLVADSRRGAAVRLFLADYSQVPAVFVALMRVLPAWRKLTAVAHTLPYDLAVIAGLQQGKPLPAGRWGALNVPVLVMTGGKSPAWLKNAQLALRDTLTGADYLTLDGQTHVVQGKALAPVLAEYFTAGRLATS